MQVSAHPAMVRLRAALPAVGEIVYAMGSLWISATMLRNWPDPNGYWRDTDALAYALLAAVYLPLVLRRRFPVAVLISTALCTGCYFTLGYYHAVAVCGLALALYTVASLRERRVSARCAVGALLVLLWGTRLAEPGIGPLSVGFVTVTTIVCWVTGDGARRLRELTRQLRREQEEKARRAVMEERIQIARELHDVIAHHVSVISVQSGLAGYVFASDPPTARRALDTIGDSAHEALAEMRRMLLVLREDGRAPAEQDPPRVSGLGRLDELVKRVAEAGVPVDVRITGTAYALPPGIDLCAYRVVQEALTNVIKHAPAAHTTVHVHYAHDEVSVRVKDDGSGRTEARTGVHVSAAAPGSAGQGLIGMRERATIYHGTVTAEPAPEGGFEVRLRVPVPRAATGAHA
ncbi:sensor histidine kinase [Streptomyces sp. NBC_01443]|uniref:sensor histidine kinase n=1 Tax=Streptomyces sp. NBC_01443 TaxID=2903868 RepID=UPI002259C409|nr:sensor histidine kinase [Streptomyces sp. NBC_01443]MCX4626135.1 sensor histidine kinase [Streptomyces sp. NBC_01443]